MIGGLLGEVRSRGPVLGMAVALAALVLGLPAWLLAARGVAPARILPGDSHPVIAAPALASGAVLSRSLFPSPDVSMSIATAAIGDVPAGDPSTGEIELLGIVGRLPDDAVALVRSPDGRSRMVAIGGEAQGWRLAALAVDAALFVKGGERVRVTLPATSD